MLKITSRPAFCFEGKHSPPSPLKEHDWVQKKFIDNGTGFF
jgi:hypothetical protein